MWSGGSQSLLENRRVLDERTIYNNPHSHRDWKYCMKLSYLTFPLLKMATRFPQRNGVTTHDTKFRIAFKKGCARSHQGRSRSPLPADHWTRVFSSGISPWWPFLSWRQLKLHQSRPSHNGELEIIDNEELSYAPIDRCTVVSEKGKKSKFFFCKISRIMRCRFQNGKKKMKIFLKILTQKPWSEKICKKKI